MPGITDYIRLLQSADALLAGDGLHVPLFSRSHAISERTVVRLLATLRDLGRDTVARRDSTTGRYTQHYQWGVRPLFDHRPMRRIGRPRDVDRDRIQSLARDGKNVEEIMTETGASRATVYRLCGGEVRSAGDQVLEWLREHAKMYTLPELAERFGKNLETMRHHLRYNGIEWLRRKSGRKKKAAAKA